MGLSPWAWIKRLVTLLSISPSSLPNQQCWNYTKALKFARQKEDPIRNPFSSSSTKITVQTLEQLSASQAQKIPIPWIRLKDLMFLFSNIKCSSNQHDQKREEVGSAIDRKEHITLETSPQT
jgi:hypothetical protein